MGYQISKHFPDSYGTHHRENCKENDNEQGLGKNKTKQQQRTAVGLGEGDPLKKIFPFGHISFGELISTGKEAMLKARETCKACHHCKT